MMKELDQLKWPLGGPRTIKETYQAPENACRMCKERGKTWNGDDPDCAFPNGYFVTKNWNCATMAKLRSLIKEPLYTNDQNCGLLVIPEDPDGDECWDYLYLGWYKSRGATEAAWVLGGVQVAPLSLKIAERICGEAMAECSHGVDFNEVCNDCDWESGARINYESDVESEVETVLAEDKRWIGPPTLLDRLNNRIIDLEAENSQLSQEVEVANRGIDVLQDGFNRVYDENAKLRDWQKRALDPLDYLETMCGEPGCNGDLACCLAVKLIEEAGEIVKKEEKVKIAIHITFDWGSPEITRRSGIIDLTDDTMSAEDKLAVINKAFDFARTDTIAKLRLVDVSK